MVVEVTERPRWEEPGTETSENSAFNRQYRQDSALFLDLFRRL